MSTKFPPVILNRDYFGVEKGTMLRFDYASAKYITVSHEEELGPEDDYYYSGSALAVDPYVVKNNTYDPRVDNEDVGDAEEKLFSLAVIPQNPAVEIPSVKEEDMKEVPGEIPKESTFYGNLIVTCGMCGNKQTLEENVADGIQIILDSEGVNYVNLKCGQCPSEMRLAFEQVGEFTVEEEETDEERKNEEVTDEPQEDSKSE